MNFHIPRNICMIVPTVHAPLSFHHMNIIIKFLYKRVELKRSHRPILSLLMDKSDIKALAIICTEAFKPPTHTTQLMSSDSQNN